MKGTHLGIFAYPVEVGLDMLGLRQNPSCSVKIERHRTATHHARSPYQFANINPRHCKLLRHGTSGELYYLALAMGGYREVMLYVVVVEKCNLFSGTSRCVHYSSKRFRENSTKACGMKPQKRNVKSASCSWQLTCTSCSTVHVAFICD